MFDGKLLMKESGVLVFGVVVFGVEAPVAQWIEHRSSKPMVAGSIPAGRAS